MKTTRQFRLWAALLLTLWAIGAVPAAALPNPGAGSPPSDASGSVPSYTAVLEGGVIGEGEMVEYTVVSPQFAGSALPEGYYAGALTVRLTGQIVIEAGGSLSIGTLSVGSQEEISPVVQGSLLEEGLIVVRAGGSLTLTCAALDVSGQGLLIVQEPGASVRLTRTEVEVEIAQWAPPTVNNAQDEPEDLWIPEGTSLTEELLPHTMTTALQVQGAEEDREVPLAWAMEEYTGQTQGELTLTGQFLGEDGAPLASVAPLTITVHWYRADSIAVTEVKWTGGTACAALFTVQELPEDADVWGEISADGGKTWSRWENFAIIRDAEGRSVCTFFETENTPAYYRLAAEDVWEHRYWTSESFLLPEEEGEDQGGNRGGSTSPGAPDREPVPPAETDADSPAETAEPSPSQEQVPLPSKPEQVSGGLAGEEEPAPEEPDPDEGLSSPVKILLAVAGIAACVVTALAAAGVGPFRRRK